MAFAIQVAKFGAVGSVGFAVDVTVFNLLRTTVFDPHLIAAGPIYAKVVSTIFAIVANWVGNRYWTFRDNRQSQTLREGLEFFTVSFIGMGIPLVCLWVTHYLLGHTSVVADNISSNVIGLLLGAIFRFVLYRYWVFAPNRRSAAVRTAAVPAAAVPAAAPVAAGSPRTVPAASVASRGRGAVKAPATASLATVPDRRLVGER
jgi:putative flippase GtrA